tara:strand:+ start:822 stop:1388 length:567 start_codon:yes stop_codon:yes gene_type:complete
MATFIEDINKIQGNFNRPIPGSSLTADPDSPAPYEKAPMYTDLYEASEAIWLQLIQPEAYIPLMNAIEDGTPILNLANVILFKGFTEGAWNPDLLLMLLEPTCYMLIALAERLDLEIVLDQEDKEEKLLSMANKEELIEKLSTTDIPASILTEERIEQMEELPEIVEETQDSLLAAPTTDNDSMLAQR